MDQEREDYADRDLPPQRRLLPFETMLGLVGTALIVAMAAALLWALSSV